MMACGKDNESPLSPGDIDYGSSDSYYVKYEVERGAQVAYGNHTERNITYTDVNGEKKVTVKDSNWDGTYGPFKKGTTVNLKVQTTGKYDSNARISVSKNKEPFVIKAETRESLSITLSYRINF